MTAKRSEGSPIAYFINDGGHAEWVLFLHAAFVTHDMFRTQFGYFRDRYNILAVDIIGHGLSSETRKGDSILKMSKWIYDIMQAEGIGKLHIVGGSLGAVLAQDDFYEMNIRFPKKSFMFLAGLGRMINKHKSGKRNYPLMIGCGRFDIPMELEMTKAWKAYEPDCQMVVFENAGHCVNMDVPIEFNRTLESFWKGA